VDEGTQCLQKAAAQGHSGAQLHLGHLYLRGYGVREDAAEAMRLYRKAAEQKELHSACSIGRLYHDGKGVSQNWDEASKWYLMEAEGGCNDAQVNLGIIFENKSQMDEALKWYRRAAQRGSLQAQAKLGDILSDGISATTDYVEACQWLILAVQARDKISEVNLRRVRNKITPQQYLEAAKRARAVGVQLEEDEKQKSKLANKR